MESAVRSPWIKSVITTGRARNNALLASQDSQNSRQPTDIGRQNPAAGNGIFGCRDWRLKIGLRDRKGHRRLKEWNDTGENPHRNGPFPIDDGFYGSRGLDGGVCSYMRTCLRQKFPIIREFIREFRLFARFAAGLRRNCHAWRDAYTKFPIWHNRELRRTNREFGTSKRVSRPATCRVESAFCSSALKPAATILFVAATPRAPASSAWASTPTRIDQSCP
jgi:hypothetical protein